MFVSKNDDLQILDEDFVVEDYAIAVAKDNTELKDAINSVLDGMTAADFNALMADAIAIQPITEG